MRVLSGLTLSRGPSGEERRLPPDSTNLPTLEMRQLGHDPLCPVGPSDAGALADPMAVVSSDTQSQDDPNPGAAETA